MVAPGAGVRWRGSSTGAPGAGLRIAFAKNLRGQGSRLSTGQAEGGPHAPEEAAPLQQAKKIPMNAPGRGDYRRKESLTHTLCRVAGPIFVNLLLCPLREHMIDVRITQDLLSDGD